MKYEVYMCLGFFYYKLTCAECSGEVFRAVRSALSFALNRGVWNYLSFNWNLKTWFLKPDKLVASLNMPQVDVRSYHDTRVGLLIPSKVRFVAITL